MQERMVSFKAPAQNPHLCAVCVTTIFFQTSLCAVHAVGGKEPKTLFPQKFVQVHELDLCRYIKMNVLRISCKETVNYVLCRDKN